MTKNKEKRKLIPPAAALSLPAIFCTLLWGTAFPGIKAGYELFSIDDGDAGSKLLFAGLRFLFAGFVVLAIGAIGKNKTGGQRLIPRKADLAPVALLGFFQTFLQYFLLYLGIAAVSGTRSAVYTSAAAFATVLASPLFFRNDKLSVRKPLGCIVGISGIVYMSALAGTQEGFTLLGDGLVILSNLSGAAGNIISKKITGSERGAVLVSGWQLIFGGTALTLSGLFLGGRLYSDNAGGWLVLLYLAAMAGIAFMIWTELLRKNPVSRVAVFNLLIPVFGTMWSGIFLGESIFTLANLITLGLVCIGIFLVNYSPETKKQSDQ